MDSLELILSPVLGAVIGYFTNWIAIKMLFRPYREKKIFGIRVPFTPGLIPKERLALSRKIGETTAAHVLTNDVLEQSLLSEDMEAKFSSVIDNIVSNLEQNDKTVLELLELLKVNNFDVIGTNEGILIDTINKQLTKESFIESISSYIKNYLVKILSNPQSIIDMDKMDNFIDSFISSKGKEFINSDEFATSVEKYITNGYKNIAENEKVLDEIVPEKFFDGIENIIKSKIPSAEPFVRNLIENNPKVDESLRVFVKNVVSENVGKLLGIFMNYDKVYDNIKNNLFEYLSDEDNQQTIVERLFEWIEKIEKSSAKSVIRHFPDGIDIDISSKIIEFAKKADGEKYVDSISGFVKGKINSFGKINLYEFILTIDEEFDEKLSRYINDYVSQYFIPFAIELLSKKIKEYKEILLRFKVSELMTKLTEENKANAKKIILGLAKTIIRSGGVYMIQNLNFEKIIEDRINDFEMEQAEDIIISVVNKELKAITWLGGLLGLIIGFVPVITSIIR